MLAAFAPSRQVGQYRIAYTAVLAAIVLPVVINNDVMRPRLLRSADPAHSQFLIRRFGLVSAAAGFVTFVVMFLAGPPAIRFAFGSEFNEAGTLAALLAISMPPHFINSWLGNVFVAEGRVRQVVKVQATMLAANIAGNLWAIPSHGAKGAALMTAITEAAGLAIYAFLFGRAMITRRLPKPAAATHRPTREETRTDNPP
jgi:O-antigen/teichoic acid export membrane protein